MKNSIIILKVLFLAIIASCTPMEDIYEEVDAARKDKNEGVVADKDKEIAPMDYVLMDEDYALSTNESVSKYKNFSSSALPKDLLPEILNAKFIGADNQEMMVSYNFYERVVKDMDNAYKLSDDDYLAMGYKYGNFSNSDDAEAKISKFLGQKFYYDSFEAGDEKTVVYVLRLTNMERYITVTSATETEVLEDDASGAYEFTKEDYQAHKGSKYGNFDDIENAIEGALSLAAVAGTYPVTYKVDVYANLYDTYQAFRIDATNNWAVATSLKLMTEPLNYDAANKNWWADPAIKITLTSNDYAVYTETGTYGNFDLRAGKTPGTDLALRAEMLGAMLEANHGVDMDDQQYLVSYDYYDGNNGVATDRIIRIAGVWQQFE